MCTECVSALFDDVMENWATDIWSQTDLIKITDISLDQILRKTHLAGKVVGRLIAFTTVVVKMAPYLTWSLQVGRHGKVMKTFPHHFYVFIR